MEDVISLGVGEPDFVTPLHIRQAGIRSLQEGHTAYTSNFGTLALRRAIAREVERPLWRGLRPGRATRSSSPPG